MSAEALREAACFGDLDAVRGLLNSGLDPDEANEVNGWTALHWAACRGEREIIRILLDHSANPGKPNKKGEVPADIAKDFECAALLLRGGHEYGGPTKNTPPVLQLPIVPNYLRHPELNHKVRIGQSSLSSSAMPDVANPLPDIAAVLVPEVKPRILKVRIRPDDRKGRGQDLPEEDFYEVDVPEDQLKMGSICNFLERELPGMMKAEDVAYLRKLPNTRLRRDVELRRMSDYQEIEVVLRDPAIAFL